MTYIRHNDNIMNISSVSFKDLPAITCRRSPTLQQKNHDNSNSLLPNLFLSASKIIAHITYLTNSGISSLWFLTTISFELFRSSCAYGQLQLQSHVYFSSDRCQYLFVWNIMILKSSCQIPILFRSTMIRFLPWSSFDIFQIVQNFILCNCDVLWSRVAVFPPLFSPLNSTLIHDINWYYSFFISISISNDDLKIQFKSIIIQLSLLGLVI